MHVGILPTKGIEWARRKAHNPRKRGDFSPVAPPQAQALGAALRSNEARGRSSTRLRRKKRGASPSLPGFERCPTCLTRLTRRATLAISLGAAAVGHQHRAVQLVDMRRVDGDEGQLVDAGCGPDQRA